MLVLLTSLNLEGLLQDERCKEFLEEVFEKHLDTMRSISERLSHWGRVRHHSPVLLAWAILHCRLEQVRERKTTIYFFSIVPEKKKDGCS